MLLSNRLHFFDKKGNELNLEPEPAIRVILIDPSNSGGRGATFNVYTNRDGQICSLEIVNGGEGYGPAANIYLRFENTLTEYSFEIPPGHVSVDISTGSILEVDYFAGPLSPQNSGFPYPAVTWRGEMYFDMVSTGLVENQEIFVVEKVVLSPQTPPNLNVHYSFPRADEGDINYMDSYQNTPPVISPGAVSDYGTGSITVKQYTDAGTFYIDNKIIYGLADTSNYEVGMIYEAVGIPAGTTVAKILSSTSLEISQVPSITAIAQPVTLYLPHKFAEGMYIRLDTSDDMAGTYLVNGVTDKKIFFQTPPTLATINGTDPLAFFRASPVWRGSVYGTEGEIFLFTVDYQEDFPVITKSSEVIYLPINGTEAGDNFTGGIFTNSVRNQPGGPSPGYQYRQVLGNLNESMMSFHLGFSAESEGSYLKLFVLEDITYNYAPSLLAQISLRGEAESEDLRLGRLLQNFGRDVTENQELILRDSDVYEAKPDYRLLNAKRKEMLLQGDQIWPYLGSYKGLVNIVNWFGYYDIRIKEYWLNVKEGDPYQGKYKQIQIPFQLENRGAGKGIEMVPSKVYKKTNKFGLFYDLNKESGELDEFGVPKTIDAFQFSNEEILIKLFALKEYLIQNFLPLNTHIVDIVGEGVYYERYTANYWNDRVEQFVVNATRRVDFTAKETRVKIVDAREYDAAERSYIYEPGVNTVREFYTTYSVKSATVTSSPVVPNVPLVYLTTASGTASPSKLWVGSCFLKANTAGSYTLTGSSNGGSGYQVGDIITLDGGVYRSPIRIRVDSVAFGGVVQDISIFNAGGGYLSLPSGFSQKFVQSENLVDNFYYSGVGTGFILAYDDIDYLIEGIKTRTVGRGYPVLDTLSLEFYNSITGAPITSVFYTLEKILVEGPKIGYFDDVTRPVALTNEPGIPVAAPIDLVAQGFDAKWDELTFTWDELWGSAEATIIAWTSRLPFGTGSLLALEILSQGSGYTRVPAIGFAGGDGQNATGLAKLRNGKLQLLEVEVTSTQLISPGFSRVFLANPFNIAAAIPYSVGAMVTGTDPDGNSIPKPATIDSLDLVNGLYFDINQEFASSGPGNFNVYVHEGAVLTNPGSNYVDDPAVFTKNGHTSSIYTWDEIGRGNFYEMEWRVTSEFGTRQFVYTSGRKLIDDLQNHRVLLPYTGFYKVEMVVYDTENNWVNEIKRSYIEAYLPDAMTSIASRFIGPSYPPGAPVEDGGVGSVSNIMQLEQNCVDTWDEAFYVWDEMWGRWINPIKTWTTWTDCDISWDTLEITPNSEENHWNFPSTPTYEIFRVSPYDNLIGTCESYDPGSGIMIVKLSPYSSNQRAQAPSTGDVIFLKRDDVTIVTRIISSSTFLTGNRVQFNIPTNTTLPKSFLDRPGAWEILRESDSTLIIKSDLYSEGSSRVLLPGEYIRMQADVQTPLNDTLDGYIANQTRWGIPIQNKILDGSGNLIGINLTGYGQDALIKREWVNGQIYQSRNGSDLLWFENSVVGITNVVLEALDTPTETSWGNAGMLYINTTPGSGDATIADPLAEIIPGFTELIIVIKDDTNGTITYQQHLRVVDMYQDTSNVGHPWDIWQEPSDPSIVCLRVLTIDGKPINDTITKLGGVSTPSSSAWIEYKYNVFPTRTAYGTGSTNASIYMDFNTRPAISTFVDEPSSAPTGWYYDHAISYGDHSLEVINVGAYPPNTDWTIVTVKDPDHEMYLCDSTYVASAADFDQDYANLHLGTKLGWYEVTGLDWSGLCSQTWNTLDWNYNLYANFKFTPTAVGTDYLQFNQREKYRIDNAEAEPESAVAITTNILNNNLNYDVWSTTPLNDNTGFSKFDYNVYSDIPGRIKSNFYVWGDPTDPNLYGNTSGLVAGDAVLANFIDAGWVVQSVPSGSQVTLGSIVSSTVPWLPACRIHVKTRQNSKLLTNVIGYLASLPQGGWLWDPNTSTIFAQFGPGIGDITEDEGFVTSIVTDTPAPSNEEYLLLEVYPRRSGLVKFLSVNTANYDIYIVGSSKNPGADALGYTKSDSIIAYKPNHDQYTDNTSISSYAYTFPLGNYYKWVMDPDNPYGGGLENSLLQFAAPYRNIQSYISEGGERALSPDGGGWYPGISWGCQGLPDGAWNIFPSDIETLYKPIAKVLIYDIDGNPIVNPGQDLYIVLNTWFDGSCFVYSGAGRLDFSAVPNLQANGASLRVVIIDSTNEEKQSFHCVLAQAFTGTLGLNSVEFHASYVVNNNLVYDNDSYLLTNIDSEKIAMLSPGMMLGSAADLIGQNEFTTRIVEVHEDYIVISNSMPVTAVDDFVAYTPLNLNFNLQTVNPKMWSRTKQADSMKLEYADSMTSAYTWEDSTISFREKKIPAGSSVLFSSDASDIAGKTTFLWNLYIEGKKICSVTDKDFLWTFLEEGYYDIELQITDTNGNVGYRRRNNFIEVYIAEHEMA